MKSFSERNPLIICAVGVGLTIAVVVGALNYKLLPFFNTNNHYSAYFAEAGGLIPGAAVQVRGFRVGQVDSLDLDDVGVLINFNVSKDIHLGDRTEATIKTKSLLGAKTLEVIPRGNGRQDGPIPIDRTHSPYQLPDALGDLSATISGLNTDQLSQSLEVLSNTFKDTPPDLKVAVAGVARFSQTLDARDAQLRNLLANANKATGVLAERSDQVVSLIANTNALLVALESQSAALEQISGRISSVTRQLKGFIAENQDTLRPALDKLNDVLTIVDNHKADIQKSIKGLNAYATSLGESVSSGPFFKAYVANLLPGQFLQPFIDAAFSDLGVDPATLLPSQRADPQLGQPGTPPLPLPYPRTGQGGQPNQNLPGAITGKPGDPRYPYRPPLPAPPPGGPPPGPPAPPPPEQRSAPETSPPPIHIPAPLEVPSNPGAGR
ncbi:MAG: phospholipid/cholesterol/gamma-HCH transport system substrate-binding protein [Mycobacterium sp.]|jgi:phospholipid/cholesterol/gamma-HCH transport system substrate-binding protein|nr:phospholipid/cholesterol/gamma-HCH transport system substrate-binding protein [Mycobacterium sp.]MDT7737163.1 phospholipid/cholesterol/gamma-HCH transport system substrate-binding protein [Mycobacterium sp.]